MSDQLQYDSSLGGTQGLGLQLNLLNFTTTRIKEIQMMKASLQESSGTKLAFQRLPKHMRRRIMSHNVKRLPRRLREIHLKQLIKSGLTQMKKNTRKYRRRRGNLLSEYVRRQRTNRWLETHIWHAKRFHLVNKWNCRLANKPCDKAFRACYRASSKHCLVQDISYFTCIEISGPRANLIRVFKLISQSNTGVSISGKAFIDGNREGTTVLFKNLDGARQAVGTIYYNWKPIVGDNEILENGLWLWIHPAFNLEVFKILVESFELNFNGETYLNKSLNISLKELKNDLNRFRLIGPLSTAILRSVLKEVPLNNCQSTWFQDYINNSANLEIYKKQWEYWKSIENLPASELSPHRILCLTVSDPRHCLPKTKIKAVLEPCEIKHITSPEYAANGIIWDAKIRSEVKNNKASNAEFAEFRSQLLVPGSELEIVKDVVPVMLIQRPANKTGYGSGWDLIVPSGWGNTFWMSLVMWGGRAGGLREFNNIRFESGQTPFLEPDTQAGLTEEAEWLKTNKAKFFRLPPNKRPNYTKFGTMEPFNLNWRRLVNEWDSTVTDNFFVLRSKRILIQLQELISKKITNLNKIEIDCSNNCIVPVRLKLIDKGIVKQFARIYLPESSDLSSNVGPKEPLHRDCNQPIRKELRSKHQKLLRRLRKQRKSHLKQKISKASNEPHKLALDSYKESMKKLWLPELQQSIRNLSCRQTIGYVTHGDFSFTQAHSCAIGYITMGALRTLLTNSSKNKVLVRNIANRQYRLANVEIIIEC